MPEFSLKTVSPSKPNGIACRYLMPRRDQTDRMNILIASFKGKYPEGSLGNAHGLYIARMALAGVQSFDAEAIVLDFRRLTYRWGNTLLRVFQDVSQFKDAGADPDEPPFPIVVVTSSLSQAAVLSLVAPPGGDAPPWHFSDMDEAITYAVQASKDWLNA